MDAYKSLSHADQTASLGAEDLELLATSAYMIGRDDALVSALDRAHRLYLAAGEGLRAVRCVFWMGLNLALRGEMGPASGWLSRAQRLLEREGRDGAEQGYLLLPAVLQHRTAGDYPAAYATASRAAEIGDHFGDADLLALAVLEQGAALIGQGRVEEGLGLLDEAMVAVTAGELSPIVTGLVYCSVIDACQAVYALRRAREWTAALTQWCQQQPDMVAFTGQCLVIRAELLQLHGGWPEALEEARRACGRFRQGMNLAAAAQAFYRQGEVHRLRGELAAAEAAYRDASRCGWEPQPGLALLRLAQGHHGAAAATIQRVVEETSGQLQRPRLLPAYVEIMLAVGDAKAARSACQELQELAGSYRSGMLDAMAAQAQGAVDLAEGDARAALMALRRAWRVWQELEVPYEAARVRVLVGLACRALGDDDAAALELEAARGVFEQLGAAPELVRAQAELATALRRRGQPGDGEDARRLLAEAARAAAELGMPVLARDIAELQAEDAEVGPDRLRLRREGQDWVLTMAGRTTRLRHSKGLAQLAVLVANPGQEISALELAGGIPAPAAPDPVLDEPARRAYRQRLADLDAALKAAAARGDADVAGRLEAERTALVAELKRAAGLAGRPRGFSDEAERARVNVTRTLRQALDQILTVDPEAGHHLIRSVHTGIRCAYRPNG